MELQPTAYMYLVFSFPNLLVGLPLNSFIMAQTYRSVIRGRARNTRDFLLFTMGISNTAVLALLVLSFITFYVWYDVYMASLFYPWFYAIYFGACLISSWAASWLCVYFCITIIPFTCSTCSAFKSRLPRIAPQLIAVSVIFSLVLVPLIGIFMLPSQNTTNSTLPDTRESLPFLLPESSILVVNVLCFLPYILIFTSLAMTITSLVLHAYRIRVSSNLSSSRIQAHVNAAITMASLLFLQSIFCLSMIVQVRNVFPPSSPGHWAFMVLNHSFCTVQAIILVIGNTRLRESLFGLWSRFINALLSREVHLQRGQEDNDMH